MRVTNLKPALVSVCSALLASLCCLLPLAVMILGLGSGAFMALTMRYQAILLPLGILGVTAGYVLYLRERRRCRSLYDGWESVESRRTAHCDARHCG